MGCTSSSWSSSNGVNLRQLLHADRVAPREALAIVPQICDALQYAHDQGVVHRDIKPENILLDRQGRVKVADFGLAKLISTVEPAASGAAEASSAATDLGKAVGTPNYMAPEQIERPQDVDHRADIYSLGVVFYQMLTGELPLGRFAPPSRKVQIDVRLDEVVLRALEKEPELRYQQASELKTQVESIVTSPRATSSRAPQAASWRHIVMVGKRGGKAVINWPGVVLVFGIILGITECGGAVVSLWLAGRVDERSRNDWLPRCATRAGRCIAPCSHDAHRPIGRLERAGNSFPARTRISRTR